MEAGRRSFHQLAIDAAGLGADDLGDNHEFLVGLEHAAGDEHLGAGQVADLGGGVGRDRAGEAEFLFAQHLFQFGALDGDDLRLGGEVGVEERGDLGTEVADGFVLRLEVEDGDGERLLAGGR